MTEEIDKNRFLKDYIKNQNMFKTQEAILLLKRFYYSLPKSVRTKDKDIDFNCVVDNFYEAFAEPVNKISKCPFVKIERPDNDKNNTQNMTQEEINAMTKGVLELILFRLDNHSKEIAKLKNQ